MRQAGTIIGLSAVPACLLAVLLAASEYLPALKVVAVLVTLAMFSSAIRYGGLRGWQLLPVGVACALAALAAAQAPRPTLFFGLVGLFGGLWALSVAAVVYAVRRGGQAAS